MLITKIFYDKIWWNFDRFNSGFTFHRQWFLHFLMNRGLIVRQRRRLPVGSVLESQRAAIYVEPYSERSWWLVSNTDPGDNAATEKTRALVLDFIVDFTQRHGSINCIELLGYDLSDPGRYEKTRSGGLFFTKCPELVLDAACILERFLWYRKPVKCDK